MIENRLHIILEEGQKIFFTSDLHFGHRNVVRFCKRPWEDEKAMNKGLIENWNSVVSDNDIVFSLGDFCWWDSNTEVRKILKQLNGKEIYLIPGNHCSAKAYRDLPEHVHLMDSCVTLWIDQEGQKTREIFLCHYPLATWSHKHNGVIQLFGHIHSREQDYKDSKQFERDPERRCDIPRQDLILSPRQYDVGVDNNRYCPVEFRDIYKKLGIEEFK